MSTEKSLPVPPPAVSRFRAALGRLARLAALAAAVGVVFLAPAVPAAPGDVPCVTIDGQDGILNEDGTCQPGGEGEDVPEMPLLLLPFFLLAAGGMARRIRRRALACAPAHCR